MNGARQILYEETDRDNVKEIDKAKDSKTIRDYSKSQVKETDRDKIKETDSDSSAIIQMKNAYSARKKLKVKQMNPVREAN
jgi:hypothetical protein